MYLHVPTGCSTTLDTWKIWLQLLGQPLLHLDQVAGQGCPSWAQEAAGIATGAAWWRAGTAGAAWRRAILGL